MCQSVTIFVHPEIRELLNNAYVTVIEIYLRTVAGVFHETRAIAHLELSSVSGHVELV